MWTLTEEHLEAISIGAGILGTGGGGNPYVGRLRARQAIREHGSVDVLSPSEVPEDARVVCIGAIGAPTVGVEKIRDYQSYYALRALEAFLGATATALITNEIGGSSSVEVVIPAAFANLPIVDADGMGRAFPEIQMKTFFTYGVSYTPMALADEKGNTAIISQAVNARWVERLARSLTVQMGSVACYAVGPMSADQVRQTAIPHTLSLARDLGRAVLEARGTHEDVTEAILRICGGKVLFQGKISDVERRTTEGFSRGKVSIEGGGEHRGHQMVIEFQNENLIASVDERVVCVVPDLICLTDDRGEPMTTERLRYGFRVTVFGFPAPELWTTAEGLAVVGPKAFGYNLDYVPLEL
jgi:DUF917 family protein